jgi:hypothetical protein
VFGGVTQGFALGYLMWPFEGSTANTTAAGQVRVAWGRRSKIAQQHDFIPVNPLATGELFQTTHENVKDSSFPVAVYRN